VRVETKAAFVCLAGALAWFAPWLAPGRALLGTHPALFRPFEEGVAPERLAAIKAAAHPLYSDKVIQHDPEVRFTLEAEARGVLPAWNPMVLGGIPHVATGLSSSLYPLMWISQLVAPPRCYALIAALQTALCGWFAFLMLRAFGARAAAAGCGALLFAASGWMSVHQEYFQLSAAATWLPLAVAGAKRALDRRGGGFPLGIAVACAFLSGFPQIAVYSLLAPALLGAGTAVARLRRRAETPRDLGRHALALAVPAALGLLVAAPQLLATAELLPHASRAPIDAKVLQQYALPAGALAGALLPDLLAPPRSAADLEAEESAARGEGRAPRHETLFGLALAGGRTRNINRFETTFALGPAALLLALFGLACGRPGARAFFGLLLAVGLLLALPGPVLRTSARVPGLDIGDPKRALLLVVLALAALAALGIERALADAAARRRALWLLGGGAALLAAAALACATADAAWLRDWAAPRIARNLGVEAGAIAAAITPDWLAESRTLLLDELMRAAAFATLPFGALLVWSVRPDARSAHGALLASLALPLALLWSESTAPIPLHDLATRPALLRHLERAPPTGRIARIGPRHEMPPWPPKLPMLANVRDAQGYVAVHLRRWRELLEAVDPGSTETIGARPIENPRLLALPLFDRLDVECAIAALPLAASPPSIDGWRLEPLDPAPDPESSYQLVLWRNPGRLGRAHVVTRVQVAADAAAVLRELAGAGFRPGEEAWLTADDAAPLLSSADWTALDPERGADRTLLFAPATEAGAARAELRSEACDELRFTVTGGGGLLVQSDCWYPGWSARVDGRRVDLLRVDHALRGVVVPPGEHEVVFRYVPRPLLVGLFLAPVGLAALVLAAARLGRAGKPA